MSSDPRNCPCGDGLRPGHPAMHCGQRGPAPDSPFAGLSPEEIVDIVKWALSESDKIQLIQGMGWSYWDGNEWMLLPTAAEAFAEMRKQHEAAHPKPITGAEVLQRHCPGICGPTDGVWSMAHRIADLENAQREAKS